LTRTFLLRESGLVVCEVAPATGSGAPVLLLHDLLADHCGPGRLLVRTAIELAQRGAVVWRGDQAGAGDAYDDGSWLRSTFWQAWATDARTLRDALSQHCGGQAVRWTAWGIAAVVALEAAPAEDALTLVDADLMQGMTYDIGQCVPIKGGRFHFGGLMLRQRENLWPRERALTRSSLTLVTTRPSPARELAEALAGPAVRHVHVDGELVAALGEIWEDSE